MTNFTNEQLQAIHASAKEIKGAQPKDMPANEYLQSVLMDKIDNISQTEADEMISKMESTIRDYNNSYNNGIETGSVAAEEMLKDSISANEMSEQDAINYLASVIVLIQNYGKDINTLTDEGLKAQVEEIIAGREINDITLQTLIKEAATAIQNSNVLAIDEKIASAIASNPLEASTITSIREQAQTPLYMAVAAYIGALKGEVGIPEEELSPVTVALGIAAGIKLQEINADLSDGKIDLPTWAKYTKIAVGVALAISVVVLAMPILVAFTLNMLLGGLIVFGSFTGSILCVVLLTFGVISFSGIKLMENANKIWEAYSRMFDKAYKWIVNLNVKEKIKKCYSDTVIKIKEFILKAKDLHNHQQVVDPSLSPVEEDIVSGNTVKPLLNA